MNNYIYILVMAGVSFVIRVLPMTLLRRPIENRFFKSFLYYVPYVTLSVMTFPAIMDATASPWAGLAALGCAIATAWAGGKLVPVAAVCCVVVLVANLL